MTNSTPLLDVKGVTLTFKGIAALTDVSFSVEKGRIVSLIGPNGAGKTSILNCISGRYTPDSGEIYLDGQDMLRLPAHKRAALGLSRTFQNIALFKGLSVLDNLMVGRHHLIHYGLLSAIFYHGRAVADESAHRRRVEDVIDFLGLSPYRHQAAGHLPYGVQKRVELGRALAAEPKLILLDEPMAGLDARARKTARELFSRLAGAGTPLVMVTHHLRDLPEQVNRVVGREAGRIVVRGDKREFEARQAVRRGRTAWAMKS